MPEKLILYVVGGVITSVTSILVGAILGDRIRAFLARIGSVFSESQRGIDDLWLGQFSMQRDGTLQEFTEVIRIKSQLGVYFGTIEQDERNYERLRRLHEKRPLRLRGELKDNLHLTGYWYHPIDTARYHGAFQLVLHPDGLQMTGRWIGYSETLRDVDSGSWTLTRLDAPAKK